MRGIEIDTAFYVKGKKPWYMHTAYANGEKVPAEVTSFIRRGRPTFNFTFKCPVLNGRDHTHTVMLSNQQKALSALASYARRWKKFKSLEPVA